jgi:tetratricopeptide (TPR) repeat protein
MNGQYDMALKDYGKAIKLEPNYAFAYASRGVAYNQKGQKGQAMKDLNKAISLDPNYEWAKAKLKEIGGY